MTVFSSGRSSPPSGWGRLERTWIRSVAALLLATALLKIHAGLTGGVPSVTHERVFGFPLAPWSIASGVAELTAVALLTVASTPGPALQLVRLLFAAILGYRLLLLSTGGGYCGCAGRLLAATPWQGREGLILGTVATAVFLINEAILAQRRWRQTPSPAATGDNPSRHPHLPRPMTPPFSPLSPEPPSSPRPAASRPRSKGWNPQAWRAWHLIVILWPILLTVALPLDRLRLIGGDEGLELTKAAHLRRTGGFDPSLWNDQPLTHTRLYAVLLGLADGAAGPRLWSVATSALLLASLAHLTETLLGRRPAAWAALLFALTPLGLELSISAMQEVPATAFGMLAVSLAAARPNPPGLARATAAAAACALGIAIKLTAALYGLAAAILLAWPGPRPHAGPLGAQGRRSVLAFLALTVVFSRILLAVGDGRPLSSLLDSHLLAFSEAHRFTATGPAASFWRYPLHEFPQMPLLFAVGLILWLHQAWTHPRQPPPAPSGGASSSAAREARFGSGTRPDPRWTVLPLLAVLFNATIRPWWPYYTLALWVALAPLAGLAVVWSLDTLRRAIAGGWGMWVRSPVSLWPALAVIVLAAAAFRDGGAMLLLYRNAQRAGDSPVLEAIRRHLPADGQALFYASDASYAFWSGLPVPEELLVVSQKRVHTGDLQPEDIPRILERQDCDFILTPLGLDGRTAPAWQSLLSRSYVVVAVAEGRELHVHRRLRPTPLKRHLRW